MKDRFERECASCKTATMAINSTKHINRTKTISSVEDLVNALHQSKKEKFGEIITRLDVLKLDVDELSTWSKDCYTRNCLECNDDFELILICWEEGQVTPIHDHGGEECWVKIIQGEFKETIYESNESGEPTEIKTNIGGPGGISYMVDFMGCHSLENVSNGRALTIHLYAKPIASCNIYNNEDGQFEPKVMEYDTVKCLV